MADQGTGQQRPPGWKKDPSGRHFGRWWDGQQWTENVISAEKVQSIDPLPAGPEPLDIDVEPTRVDEVGEDRQGPVLEEEPRLSSTPPGGGANDTPVIVAPSRYLTHRKRSKRRGEP